MLIHAGDHFDDDHAPGNIDRAGSAGHLFNDYNHDALIPRDGG